MLEGMQVPRSPWHHTVVALHGSIMMTAWVGRCTACARVKVPAYTACARAGHTAYSNST